MVRYPLHSIWFLVSLSIARRDAEAASGVNLPLGLRVRDSLSTVLASLAFSRFTTILLSITRDEGSLGNGDNGVWARKYRDLPSEPKGSSDAGSRS